MLFLSILINPFYVSFNAIPNVMSVFSPQFPLHFLDIWSLCQFFISHSFHTTSPCQPSCHQFTLKTFLHSNLHSQFTHSFLVSSLNSHDSSYQVVFRKTRIFCCFSVNAIVSSAFVYPAVKHELSTFPLSLRDMCLCPITPSTFLQAFAPAVILIKTKPNYLVDFVLGN